MFGDDTNSIPVIGHIDEPEFKPYFAIHILFLSGINTSPSECSKHPYVPLGHYPVS